MNERIRTLRKALGLTLEEFGRVLGVQKTCVSKIEHGITNLTEQNVRLICSVSWPGGRRVSEAWLRTGAGCMFADLTIDDEIMAYISKLPDAPEARLQRQLLLTLARLDEAQWEWIADTMKRLLDLQHPPDG